MALRPTSQGACSPGWPFLGKPCAQGTSLRGKGKLPTAQREKDRGALTPVPLPKPQA